MTFSKVTRMTQRAARTEQSPIWKTRRLVTAAVVVGLLALVGLSGRDVDALATVAEERTIADVDEVEVDGVGTLIITQGETEELTVTAEADVLPKIKTTVSQGRLTIEPDGSFTTSEEITYELTIKDLRTIIVEGSVEAEAEEFSTEELRLEAGGSASMTLGELEVDKLEVKIEGSATVELAGSATEQQVEIDGSGTYEAEKLESEDAVVRVDGAGEATVQVSDTLEAEAGGAGTISYAGDATVEATTSGAGEVEPLD
jgi:hypothetical protein